MSQRVSALYGPLAAVAASIPVLASASCDSTSAPAPMDASAESSAAADAAEGGEDTADADAGSSTCAAGSGLVCPVPISACTQHCPTTWAAVLQACAQTTSPALAETTQPVVCGAYDGVLTTTIDRGEFEYFDRATGEAVAVTGYSNGVSNCLYGPPCFVPPGDCTSLPLCGTPADAAADAIASEGGVDAAASD
jgi:hypothetical protein